MKISHDIVFKRTLLPFYLLWIAVSWYLPTAFLINVVFSDVAYAEYLGHGTFYQHFLRMSGGAEGLNQQPAAAMELPDNNIVSKPQDKPDQTLLFSLKKEKSWYDRLTWFANVTREHRQVNVSRAVDNTAFVASDLQADYDTWLLSFTLGGNVFKATSVNWDVTSEHFELQGDLVETNSSDEQIVSPVSFNRHKLLSEWFIEHDLGAGYTIGGDAYYSQSRYRDDQLDAIFTDTEYGGGLLLSRKFRLAGQTATVNYILSHRRLSPGDTAFDNQARTFHSLLASYQHRWRLDLLLDISARYSYYPQVDEFNFWESRGIGAMAGELVYYPASGHQLAVRVDHSWFGSGDTITSFSLNYEHEFGVSEGKRRKRRRRVPQLLIR